MPSYLRLIVAAGLLGLPAAALASPCGPSEAGASEPACVDAPVVLGARDPARAPRATDWDVRGELRLRGQQVADFGTDDQGTRHGRERFFETRILVGGVWSPVEALRLEVELEALNGQVFGDSTDLGRRVGDDVHRYSRHEVPSLSTVLPRRALVQARLPIGLVQVGLTSFGWGEGILAHDGVMESEFGDPRQGNIVGRALFATRPLDRSESASPFWRTLTVLVGGDWILRDDNASYLDGDRAWGAVGGVRVGTDEHQFGLFEAVRWQEDRPDARDPRGEPTRVLAFATDVHARTRLWGDDAHQLVLEAEAVFLAGTTTRPWLEETIGRDTRIRSFGALGRLRYDNDVARLTLRLEGGFASGDNDPRDDVFRQFSFHSDYKVGLVLFDQVLPMITARAADRTLDPALVAVPPSGLRYTVNQGTVTNALYTNPVVRWRPASWADLRLGWVWARSAGDLIDVYQSALAGGYNTTPGGVVQGSRRLGHELDVSVRAPIDLGAGLTLVPGVEGGVLFAGSAFDGIGGIGTPWTARALLDLRW